MAHIGRMKRLAAAALAALIAVAPTPGFAWGGSGHRIIGRLAIRGLPADVPAFVRSARAVEDIGELSREPDRNKAAGKMHDADREGAHFIDLDEDARVEDGKGTVGPPIAPLAATRADYAAQLRAAGFDEWKGGYLPYAIVESWQQVMIDFAYWRVLDAAERNPKWKAHRAWFKADRIRREALLMRDIGELGHFVGDGSQPMHVSIHYNGWGDYPNPGGYSTAKLHSPFEGDLVKTRVTEAAVAAKVAAYRHCDCALEQRVTDYLTASMKQVVPFFEMEKAGGMAAGDPRGAAFATERLAVGAGELRDLMVEAWRASATRNVGWKPIAVQDVLSGKVDPYVALSSVD